MQLDGVDGETDCWCRAENVNETMKGYVKSECTQRSVCLSGGGAHNACFMMIGKFP